VGRTVASVRSTVVVKNVSFIHKFGFVNPVVFGWMKPKNVVTTKEFVESSSSIPSSAPYVDSEVAAKYLSIEKRMLMDRARSGQLPGHPLPGSKRKIWRFKLSELDACMQAQSAQRTIPDGSPRSRKGKL
jgi:hypothetical protein